MSFETIGSQAVPRASAAEHLVRTVFCRHLTSSVSVFLTQYLRAWNLRSLRLY
jgi:hypothetical protein